MSRKRAPARRNARRRRPWLRRIVFAVFLAGALPVAVLAVYRVVAPPVTPLMLIRAFEGHETRREWRNLESISPHLVRAVIAAEDNLFCRHAGFDTDALRAQVAALRRGERARGASTLTQQTVKNVLLWPGRSWLRKGLEAALTPVMELLWPKPRIVEVYLNVAEWGPGLYGAEAAARHHFGKSAARLTPGEAARLAVVLPSPMRLSPGGGYAQERSRTILRRVDEIAPLLGCVNG